jgi:hypothetical protein
MFLSSYAPLFALLAYTNRETQCAWVSLALAATVATAGLGLVLWTKRDEKGPRLVVAHAEPQDGEVLAYIATYLIPFLGLDLATSDDIVVFCGFLLVLMVVYINSSMLFINPLLSVCGYHSFAVTDGDGHTYTLIARRRDLEPNVALRPAQIDRYVRLEVRRER